MPEGPEIRRAADAIEKVLKGERIEKVQFTQRPLLKHQKTLSGKKVLGVETRGKALLTHFEHGWSIYSHNQLYGVWQVVPRGEWPTTKRQLRLALHTSKHSALLYSATDISVWRSADLGEHHFLRKLGPDILNPALTAAAIAQRMMEKPFAGRSLAALYLDQGFLAGVGNYLRSEILFAAGLDPLSCPRQLSATQRARLARQTLAVSQRSYKSGGVTLTAKQYRWLTGEGLSFQRARFAVFGRADKPCHSCGNKVKRRDVGARRLYYCSSCQAVIAP